MVETTGVYRNVYQRLKQSGGNCSQLKFTERRAEANTVATVGVT